LIPVVPVPEITRGDWHTLARHRSRSLIDEDLDIDAAKPNNGSVLASAQYITAYDRTYQGHRVTY
jgi:hypothetical protein